MKQKMTFNLLTVMGKVTTSRVEATGKLHNETAGNPGGVVGIWLFADPEGNTVALHSNN